jgi:hypothetical protein
MKKNLSSYLPLALALLITIGCAVLYVHLFLSLSSMRQERLSSTSVVSNSRQLLRQEQQNNANLSSYFVKAGEEASFISSIETACQGFSLSCTLSSLNETVTSGNIKVFHATVTASGDFNGVMQLEKSFEHSTYPVQILKVSLVSVASDPASSTSSVSWQSAIDIETPVLGVQ